MVADTKGTSVGFVLTEGCARGVRTPGVPVEDGGFTYRGQVGKVKVRIRGTFVDERRARIRIDTTGPGCAGSRSVVAALS